MKNLYGYFSVFLCLVLLLLPLIPGKSEAAAVNTVPAEETTEAVFRIKNIDTGEISNINAKDYIIGVVSAEMPALYHEEALKAQAVAAYTFALYRQNENKNNDYDLTTSSSLDQAYIGDDAAKEKWGDEYSLYSEKIAAAVNSVFGQTVTYNGKCALTLYTAISGGKTESAKNLWGEDIAYLTPVESIGDLLSPNYLSSASFTQEQIIEKIPEIKDIPRESWFLTPIYSDSGTVLSMKFGEESIDGSKIRDALGLKSANFDVVFENDAFNFNVRGYGHLVGMSQYGANYMALQGSSYTEILSWYYKGCTVS